MASLDPSRASTTTSSKQPMGNFEKVLDGLDERVSKTKQAISQLRSDASKKNDKLYKKFIKDIDSINNSLSTCSSKIQSLRVGRFAKNNGFEEAQNVESELNRINNLTINTSRSFELQCEMKELSDGNLDGHISRGNVSVSSSIEELRVSPSDDGIRRKTSTSGKRGYLTK